VDVMPTLADIAGLPAETANTSVLDGVSLMPLLYAPTPTPAATAVHPPPPPQQQQQHKHQHQHQPHSSPSSRSSASAWASKPAFSQYPRRVVNATFPWKDDGIDHVNRCVFVRVRAGVGLRGCVCTRVNARCGSAASAGAADAGSGGCCWCCCSFRWCG
jgi:hypothetical protein